MTMHDDSSARRHSGRRLRGVAGVRPLRRRCVRRAPARGSDSMTARRALRAAGAGGRAARRATTSTPSTARRSGGQEAEAREAAARRDRRAAPRRSTRDLRRCRRRRPKRRRRAVDGCGTQYLARQLAALRARVRDAAGQEADLRRRVAGALRRGGAAPRRGGVRGGARRSSTAKLPGEGPLIERYDAFQQAVRHPARPPRSRCSRRRSRGCRGRTLTHVALPAGESFTVEYVTDKSWSGYNWYQGNFRSLIQVNTDLPIYIDRAIDLACHEGYPGPSRLQRAAREAPGARSRLDRVLGLPAVLAAVADRRGHRQLRHRGRVPDGRAAARSSATCCSRWPASTRRRSPSTTTVLALVDRLSLCRQRGGAALPRRRDRRAPRRPTGSSSTRCMPRPRAEQRVQVHRPVPQLRDQLQPRQGPGARATSSAQRRGDEPARAAGRSSRALLSSPRLPSGLK